MSTQFEQGRSTDEELVSYISPVMQQDEMQVLEVLARTEPASASMAM